MDGLDLNSQPEGWANLGSYRRLLQSDGGSGSNGGRTAVRSPPSRRGTGGPVRTVGKSKPRGAGPSSSRGRGGGGGLPPASVAHGGPSGPWHGGSDGTEAEDDEDMQDIVQVLD